MSAIERLLGPLKRSILLLLNRAVVNRVNSDGEIQTLQLGSSESEVLHDVPNLETYGFTSKVKEGAEALLLSFGGDRSSCVAICVGDRRYRLKGLKDGEVALYDDIDQSIILTREGLVINAPLGLEVKGNAKITGTLQVTKAVQLDKTLQVKEDITGDADALISGISVIGHTHSGVQPGSGVSAGPVPS